MVRKKPFEVFSQFYDLVVANEKIPYSHWIGFVKKTLRNHDLDAGLIVDFACGTGNFSFPLEEAGYTVIGFDISKQMIAVAKEKAKKKKSKIRFFVQDIRKQMVHSVADVVICMFDSLNHLSTENDLFKVFRTAHSAIKQQGLFIFDLNPYQRFIKQNFPKERIQKFNDLVMIHYNEYQFPFWFNRLSLIIKENKKLVAIEEVHRERAFKRHKVIKLLKKAGFLGANCFSDGNFKFATEDSDRWFFVATK